MKTTNDPLDQYARPGKAHPRLVLEQVVNVTGAVDSVDALLRSGSSTDSAVVRARSLAMYLLGKEEVSGLSVEFISRIFECSVAQVRLCQTAVVRKQETDETVNGQLLELLQILQQRDGAARRPSGRRGAHRHSDRCLHLSLGEDLVELGVDPADPSRTLYIMALKGEPEISDTEVEADAFLVIVVRDGRQKMAEGDVQEAAQSGTP